MIVSSLRRVSWIALVLLGACAAPPPEEASEPTADAVATPAPSTDGRSTAENLGSDHPAAVSVDLPFHEEAMPESFRACAFCHEAEAEDFARHGMAYSLRPAAEPEPGVVDHPAGRRYELTEGGFLEATFPDGGFRRQRVVGRIGAGLYDTSWVTMELDPVDGSETGRLFFAPVETITGHGHELSPFDLETPSAGLDMAISEGCLTCHTTDRLSELSGTDGARSGQNLMPNNALGADAFEHLNGIGCADCHGDPDRHLELMPVEAGDIGIARLGELTPGQERDICARCHLQGDVRIDLVYGAPSRERPLAGQVPVLIAKEQDDDFRFVGQIERLALSACFKATPEMTCTTCHEVHRGARQQGTASFDAACVECHECVRPSELTAEEVTGHAARTADGCVDCHVRRSQPFDLPHILTADHFIRRRIPLPRDDIPHRQFTDPKGELVLYDDGRLAAALATPEGRRWRNGILAMGLMTMARFDEAIGLFNAFPPPGTAAALKPTAPAEMIALETEPSFHEMRAMALMTSRRIPEAIAAFNDSLKLDPTSPSALMGRARLRFATGDVQGALEDTQVLIDAFPRAEQPWNLRVEMAERLNNPGLVVTALKASVQAWPSNPMTWYKLGMLLRQQGREAEAQDALDRARLLQPSLFESGP